MVIHMEDGVCKCFTRKLNEYTSLYQPILDKIKPFVKVWCSASRRPTCCCYRLLRHAAACGPLLLWDVEL
jgi:hypothetical protein